MKLKQLQPNFHAVNFVIVPAIAQIARIISKAKETVMAEDIVIGMVIIIFRQKDRVVCLIQKDKTLI